MLRMILGSVPAALGGGRAAPVAAHTLFHVRVELVSHEDRALEVDEVAVDAWKAAAKYAAKLSVKTNLYGFEQIEVDVVLINEDTVFKTAKFLRCTRRR